MSFHREAQRLRRQLATKGLSYVPCCQYCGTEQTLRSWPDHNRQCYRDCLSRCIEQLDKQLACGWATEPLDEAHRQQLDADAEAWRQERCEAWDALMATTPFQPFEPLGASHG